MKQILKAISICLATSALIGCATVGGAAVGAGIGSVAGDTETGALIGGGMGLLYDIL